MTALFRKQNQSISLTISFQYKKIVDKTLLLTSGKKKFKGNHVPQLVRKARGSLAVSAGPHQHQSQHCGRNRKSKAPISVCQGMYRRQHVIVFKRVFAANIMLLI